MNNFSRLISSQVSKNTNIKNIFVKKCLSHFTTPELLNKHSLYCSSNNETVAVKMPPKNSSIFFRIHDNRIKLPFVIYADFECFTKPIHNCDPNPQDSFTVEYQHHTPCGFCLYIKPLDNFSTEIQPNH